MLTSLRGRNGIMMIGLLTLLLLATVLTWLWLSRPERQVRLRMARLAESCTFKAEDTEVVRLGKARTVAAMMADPLTLDTPIEEVNGTQAREEMMGSIVALMKTTQSGSLTLGPETFEQVTGTAVTLQSAVVGEAKYEGDRSEKRAFRSRFTWRKLNGVWQLHSVEKVSP